MAIYLGGTQMDDGGPQRSQQSQGTARWQKARLRRVWKAGAAESPTPAGDTWLGTLHMPAAAPAKGVMIAIMAGIAIANTKAEASLARAYSSSAAARSQMKSKGAVPPATIQAPSGLTQKLYAAKRTLMWGDMHLTTEDNSAGDRFTKLWEVHLKGNICLPFGRNAQLDC
ncbi:MAG: hypothetical protein FRX49_03124 [Trebouxia sp. A1-2]|nr:MAG: hypothetical protein FRX49_03124 [Trebouxia sp. A1-2]